MFVHYVVSFYTSLSNHKLETLFVAKDRSVRIDVHFSFDNIRMLQENSKVSNIAQTNRFHLKLSRSKFSLFVHLSDDLNFSQEIHRVNCFCLSVRWCRFHFQTNLLLFTKTVYQSYFDSSE